MCFYLISSIEIMALYDLMLDSVTCFPILTIIIVNFQVPELAGFWLLSLLQAPFTLYLLANIDTIILPLERAVNIVLLIFLVVQLCLGFRALQLMVQAQTIKFHLSNFDTLRTN